MTEQTTARCLFCNRPFGPDNRPHLVATLPKQGMIPYCEGCHPRLNLGTKKSLVIELINNWRAGPLDKDYDAILQAALDTVALEHLLR